MTTHSTPPSNSFIRGAPDASRHSPRSCPGTAACLAGRSRSGRLFGPVALDKRQGMILQVFMPQKPQIVFFPRPSNRGFPARRMLKTHRPPDNLSTAPGPLLREAGAPKLNNHQSEPSLGTRPVTSIAPNLGPNGLAPSSFCGVVHCFLGVGSRLLDPPLASRRPGGQEHGSKMVRRTGDQPEPSEKWTPLSRPKTERSFAGSG